MPQQAASFHADPGTLVQLKGPKRLIVLAVYGLRPKGRKVDARTIAYPEVACVVRTKRVLICTMPQYRILHCCFGCFVGD